MSIFEYDEEKEMELIRKSEWEDGKLAGLAEGEQIGLSNGLSKGLKALIDTLKPLFPDFDAVYNAVIANEEYKNVTKEEARKYY